MNILMINVPFAGHTNPTLPLSRALVERGHRVSYINAESFRGPIEATGARFVPYGGFPARPSARQIKTLSFRAAYNTALSLTERFDLLIYEMFFYPGYKIAQLLNIPCVRQFSQPAWNTHTAANAGPLLRLSLCMIDRMVMRRKDAAALRLENSTLAKAVLFDKPALNVVYVPELFQSDRDTFGEDYLFTLPVPTPGEAPSAFDYDALPRPLAYVSLGSIISNRGFCRECVRAFGNRGLSVILSTGKVSPESLGPLPANIHARSFVPQVEVLRHADVFLTHCGMNSVNEAMLLGVPMVAMPFVNDQLSNARRVVELGIGRRVRSFPSSSRELYSAVRATEADQAMRARCRDVQAQIAQGLPLSRVVERIEALG